MANKKKVKVIYDRQNCIGAATCEVIAPDFFKIADDGKADMIGAKKDAKTGKFVLDIEVDEKELKRMKQAAVSCPVQVIEVDDQ